MHDLLIITSTKKNARTIGRTRLVRELSKQTRVDVGLLDETEIVLSRGSCIATVSGHRVDTASAIHLRWLGKRFAVSEWYALYVLAQSSVFIQPPLLQVDSRSKLVQMAILARAGIAIPKTLYITSGSVARVASHVVATVGLPVIVKACHGTKGKEVERLLKRSDVKDWLQQHRGSWREYLFQEYVENEGDLRVLVIGESVKAVGRRCGQQGEWRNNVSLGGTVTSMPISTLPKHVVADAVRAKQLLHVDIAGVDLVYDSRTDEYLFLEVNFAPGFATPGVSDAYLDYFQKKLSA